ncbi:MAG: PKD repeat protein [Cyclobacteriaceae bacterium]|jgi:PKD repeat protein
MKSSSFLSFIFFVLSTLSGLLLSGQTTEQPAAPSTRVVIKFANQQAVQATSKDFSLKSLKRTVAPQNARPPAKQTLQEPVSSLLDNIFWIDVPASYSLKAFCDSLSSIKGVVYVEPEHQESLLYIPNDPAARVGGEQDYLQVIKAYAGWEITRGDSNIIIGIIDTGIDLDQEDLQQSIFTSTDIINGIDDDNNGYIDDYYGYDFANNDNDPFADNDVHGTRVAGISGADTDNGTGIAGLGFNSKIRALKIFNSLNNFSGGSYEAILYAADNGYDVVNLSWGSIDSYSQFNQDVINYAVLEKDLVVVAAAGNTPGNIAFYPAAYDNVLSVAATNLDDSKASFSSYHPTVDLAAPGVNIYTTINSGYGQDNGSSYAAPMVAGAAALLKAHRPNLNAVQLMEYLRSTADPIYEVSDNSQYVGRLGRGRLNIERALTATNPVSMHSTLSSFSSAYDQLYFGDTVTIYLSVENILSPVYEAKAILTSQSVYAQIIDDSYDIGFLATSESELIGPFSFVIAEDAPVNTKLDFVLTLSDADRYEDFHLYSFETAPGYVNLTNGTMVLTVDQDGDLGYAADGYLEGLGFIKDDVQLAKNIGFFVAIGDTLLIDNINNTSKRDSDFISLSQLRPNTNRDDTRYTYHQFTDSSQSFIKVEQTTIVWKKTPTQVAAILYRMTNINADTIFGLTNGLYIDYDLGSPNLNSSRFDQLKTIISSDGSSSAALRAISPENQLQRLIALDNAEISDSIKLSWITSDFIDSLGYDSLQNTALMIGNSTSFLSPGQSVSYTYLIGGANQDSTLMAQLDSAEVNVQIFASNPPISKQYTVCAGGSLLLVPDLGIDYFYFSDPFAQDTLAVNDSLLVANVSTDTLIYGSRKNDIGSDAIFAFAIDLIENIADFELPADTIFLGDVLSNRVALIDKSVQPISWFWDFGNGSQASGLSNPTPVFNDLGSYEVSLTITTEQGCSDTITKTLVIAARPESVPFDQVGFCPNETLTINTGNTLGIYVIESAIEPVLVTNIFTLAGLSSDTILYISQFVDGIESAKKEIQITKNLVDLDFQYTTQSDSLFGFYATFEMMANNFSSVEWTLDSSVVSQLTPVDFEITNDTASLFLNIETTEGCLASLEETLIFSSSITPLIEPKSICQGDEFQFSFQDGSLFGVFTDSSYSSVVAKTTLFTFPGLFMDTTLYIAALNEILPGDLKPIQIQVVDYQFEIVATADTIYLNQGRSIGFSVSMESAAVLWFIDSVFETSDIAPTLFFSTPGTHQVIAEGTHPIGCEYRDTLTIEVIAEFIEPLSLARNKPPVLYPIPTTDSWHIDASQVYTSVAVSNMAGKSFGTIEVIDHSIDARSLPPGLYILSFLGSSGAKYQVKAIKQ